MESNIPTQEPANNPITINTLSEYIEQVNSISKDNKFLYRGHADKDWKLQPSVGRLVDYSIELENQMLGEFKCKYHSYTDTRPFSDLGIMMLAQHYGLPTRLLDWTNNHLIALYFACKAEKEKDGCVYALQINDAEFKDTQNKLNPFTVKKNHIIIPDYIDTRYTRYINQGAFFELFANPKSEQEEYKQKIIIPKDSKKQIFDELNKCGINELYVYPTLESLSKVIKEKYEKNN